MKHINNPLNRNWLYSQLNSLFSQILQNVDPKLPHTKEGVTEGKSECKHSSHSWLWWKSLNLANFPKAHDYGDTFLEHIPGKRRLCTWDPKQWNFMVICLYCRFEGKHIKVNSFLVLRLSLSQSKLLPLLLENEYDKMCIIC